MESKPGKLSGCESSWMDNTTFNKTLRERFDMGGLEIPKWIIVSDIKP
jgi:hypothetical protein